jgi:hypothetical protein
MPSIHYAILVMLFALEAFVEKGGASTGQCTTRGCLHK